MSTNPDGQCLEMVGGKQQLKLNFGGSKTIGVNDRFNKNETENNMVES